MHSIHIYTASSEHLKNVTGTEFPSGSRVLAVEMIL
jgi:hypothetical protein